MTAQEVREAFNQALTENPIQDYECTPEWEVMCSNAIARLGGNLVRYWYGYDERGVNLRSAEVIFTVPGEHRTQTVHVVQYLYMSNLIPIMITIQ